MLGRSFPRPSSRERPHKKGTCANHEHQDSALANGCFSTESAGSVNLLRLAQRSELDGKPRFIPLGSKVRFFIPAGCLVHVLVMTWSRGLDLKFLEGTWTSAPGDGRDVSLALNVVVRNLGTQQCREF